MTPECSLMARSINGHHIVISRNRLAFQYTGVCGNWDKVVVIVSPFAPINWAILVSL